MSESEEEPVRIQGRSFSKNEQANEIKERKKGKYQRFWRKDRIAEQPKLDCGDDDQYEQRRENGLSPELRGDRSVHTSMKVSSSSSEMKSELRSLRIGDNYDCQALSIKLPGADHAGYVAETCEIGGAYETFRKGGAALAKMPKEMLKVPCY